MVARRSSGTHRRKLVREAREYFKRVRREIRLGRDRFRQDRNHYAFLRRMLPLWREGKDRFWELLRSYWR